MRRKRKFSFKNFKNMFKNHRHFIKGSMRGMTSIPFPFRGRRK